MLKLCSTLMVMFLIFTSASSYAGSQLEENKNIVLDFYEKMINEKNFNAGLKYLGASYIQHNPRAADGVAGLKNYVEYLRQNFPHSHSEVKRVLGEGDFVILHVHSILEPNTKGNAIIDIFRLDKGKIVEHWDVIQPVPDKSANDNTMF